MRNLYNELKRHRNIVEKLENVYYALNDMKEFDEVLFQRILGDVTLENVDRELKVYMEKLSILEQEIIDEAFSYGN